MTRLVITVSLLLAPMFLTTPLRQDVDYWDAAHTWQHHSPASYYTWTTAVSLLAAAVVLRRGRVPGRGAPRGDP